MTGSADSAVEDGEGPRRFLIATAVSRYPKFPQWDRPGLVEARERIIELFTGKLGYRHQTALGLDPTKTQLTDQLRAFCTSPERREDDLVVVYLSGHGEVLEDGGEHVLLMADADPADVTYTALATADLVRVLRGTKIRRLLLILDTCYSGQGGNELAAAALERLSTQWGRGQSSSGLVIVSSAQPHQQAQAGVFPELLVKAVGSRATAGHAPAHLSVSAVVQQINDHPDKPGYQHISLSLLGLSGEPPDFLTNPRHDVRLTDVDLALQDAAEFDAYALQRETEFTSRLLVRAMGYHGDGAQGWWFCGRHQALSDLADWLNHDGERGQQQLPGMGGADECVRVVTAGPGSGKTAVLGLVAALTMPERRRTVPVDSLGLAPDWIPHEGSIDVVMYAQNLTNTQVLSGLAAAAGFKCTSVGEFLNTLKQRTGDRERPFTVLIDALDEATTPDTLCSQIVRPLIEHSRGRIRLLLGTRPYLLNRLGLNSPSQRRDRAVIDLDSRRYADRQALLAYTMRNLLQSHRTSPYRTTDPGLLRAVAQAVGDAAGTSFLVARFAAYTLASADMVVADPHSPRWRASLPRHASQAMRDDLTRRLGPDARRATDLLRPLAYAEGQGLPWEDIWAPLASAISGRPYTDEDLLWLRHHAGSYVVEATENGRSAYRLYHQALTEHLREDTDPIAVHAAFVDTLTDCVPYRGDASHDWARAHPYALNHLATHAAAAGRIDDLLHHTEYLVHASPPSLTPHLQDASTPHSRLTAAVYRTSYELHVTASPTVRRNLLALNAARAGADTLLQQLNSCARTSEWLPAWATGNDFTPALRQTLTEHGDHARTLVGTVLDGRPVALIGTGFHSVSGDWGRVYVWDPVSGQLLGEPLAFTDDVQALACIDFDGRPVAVIGTGTGTSSGEPGGRVYVCDLASGQLLGEPLTHTDSVDALACTVFGGRLVTVTLVSFGPVRAWNVMDTLVTTGLGPRFRDRTVEALTCIDLDGRPVAVIGTSTDVGVPGGEVYVWDLITRQFLGEPLTLADYLWVLECTVVDGRPVVVIGTGAVAPGRMYVWDVASCQLLGEPLTLDGSMEALACTVLDGRPVAATVTDGGVYVWDVASCQLLGEPLTLHGSVKAVACTVLDGRPVAVIGTGTDGGEPGGGVYVFDLAGRQLLGEPLTLHGSVKAVACTVLDGRPVAVIGTDLHLVEGEVHVWDLASRQLLGEPLPLPDGVHALECTVLDGRPVAGIAADQNLYVRDIRTGALVEALVIPDLADVAFSDGGSLVVAMNRDIALLMRRSHANGRAAP
jgi:WD40 repeat protein